MVKNIIITGVFAPWVSAGFAQPYNYCVFLHFVEHPGYRCVPKVGLAVKKTKKQQKRTSGGKGLRLGGDFQTCVAVVGRPDREQPRVPCACGGGFVHVCNGEQSNTQINIFQGCRP